MLLWYAGIVLARCPPAPIRFEFHQLTVTPQHIIFPPGRREPGFEVLDNSLDHSLSPRVVTTAVHGHPGGGRSDQLSDAVRDIAFVPMHVEGEDSLIGNMEVTAEIVQERFRRRLHEHGVPAARAMLERGPVEAILFICTIWGGMIREVADLIDAACIDPMVASAPR